MTSPTYETLRYVYKLAPSEGARERLIEFYLTLWQLPESEKIEQMLDRLILERNKVTYEPRKLEDAG